MKERGDCEGGRAPNIDQGASVAMRQRGACAKVERKARTRRDFLAFFARCAIAYRKFTLSDGIGSLASALEHAASGSLGILTRVRVRALQAVFDFCLHAFTSPSQATHSQIIKCEDFYIRHLHPPSPPFRSIVSARRHAPSRPPGHRAGKRRR